MQKHLVPILAVAIPLFIHLEAQKFAETQLRITQQQFDNDVQIKYLDIFYGDLTSKDSVTRLNSVALLKLMNADLANRLARWIKDNPNISKQIKDSVGQELISIRQSLPRNGKKARYPSDAEIESFFTYVQRGNIDAVKSLLPNKYLISARDHAGDDALILTSKLGNFRMFQTLLQQGAKIGTHNASGFNLLQVTVSADNNLNAGHLQIAKFLLKHGFKATERVSDGSKLLMLAIPAGENADDNRAFEMITLLIENGANPCIQDVFRYRGSTPRVVNLINQKCAEFKQ